MNTHTYDQFLRNKINFDKTYGFTVEDTDINPALKPHQRKITQWAVKGGRRAIFASWGLGKTAIQLETVRLTIAHGAEHGLIVCPLGVRQEFINDATNLLNMPAPQFIRTNDQINKPGIYLTNYESVRDGKLDPNLFDVTSLDEAAILRSYGSITYQTFLTLFDKVPYRFVATATPSPNRYKELIHYAGFLGVMDTGLALTRWFQRDSTKANNLTLYPHKEAEFWRWLSTWSVWLQSPADIGYNATGYDLPDLELRWHEVDVDHTNTTVNRDGQAHLFRGGALGVKDVAREKRDSLPARVAEATRIIDDYLAADPADQVIVWVDLNDEQDAVERALTTRSVSFSSVHGALTTDECERRIAEWRARHTSVLIGKPVQLGQGLNLQQCNKAIFVGVTYKFNDTIQACHRIQRFGQTRTCQVHIIHAESEREVVRTLNTKWAQHEELTATMTDLIREHGLSAASVTDTLARSIGVTRSEETGNGWLAAHNDCVVETHGMDTNSVDLIVTSIPFCYDDQTEVLTRRGWIGFDRLKVDEDEIATVNPSGQHLEWQRPSHVVWEHYEGEMIHFTGRSFDLLVTPNHRMYAARRGAGFSPDRFGIVTAGEMARDYETANRQTIGGTGRILRGWRTCLIPPNRGDGDRPERIDIPRLPSHIRTGHGVELSWIAAKDFMTLAGWYLSEGHADPFREGRQGGRISIGQSPIVNADNYQAITDLFIRVGLPPSLHKNQITVWCRNLAYFLQEEFGHCAANKRIPRWVLDLHPELLTILRDTMMRGDGSNDGTSYASISPQLRGNFQELCIKTGWRCTLTDGKVVNTGSAQLYPEIRQAPERIAYSGMIGCATVPNSLMIVRRNGKSIVSGNSNHYEYTPSINDFGHTDDNEHFWAQMDYLTPQLLRVLNPGRLYCCHVKDRILFGSVTGAGAPTVSPFHAEAIMHGRKHGFDYLGMITVVTDVVRENNQTYRLGWTENSKDSTKMGVGSPEYILLFRKPQTDRSKGYADLPVTKDKTVYTRARWQVDAHAFYRESGNRLLTPDELAALPADQMSALFTDQTLRNIYDYEHHITTGEALEQRGSLPATFMSLAPGSWHPDVWHDINRMDTLNTEQSRRAQQMHVCPLQLGLIKRLIVRYSNPGELVYDPFGGIMSVPLVALQEGRRGRGVELNPDYFRDGVAYLRAHDRKAEMPTLFDLMALEEEAKAS